MTLTRGFSACALFTRFGLARRSTTAHWFGPEHEKKIVWSSVTDPTWRYIWDQALKNVTLCLHSFVLASITMKVELPVASHHIRVVFLPSPQEHVSVVFANLSAVTFIQIIVCGISTQVRLPGSVDGIPVPCHSYELFCLKLQSKV